MEANVWVELPSLTVHCIPSVLVRVTVPPLEPTFGAAVGATTTPASLLAAGTRSFAGVPTFTVHTVFVTCASNPEATVAVVTSSPLALARVMSLTTLL